MSTTSSPPRRAIPFTRLKCAHGAHIPLREPHRLTAAGNQHYVVGAVGDRGTDQVVVPPEPSGL